MSIFYRLATAIGIAVLFAGAAEAQSPSFSCRHVTGCPEAVICDTPGLARLDNTMAGLYFSLKGQASRRGARVLLDGQREWLDSRNRCGCNAGCLFRHYRNRIADFRGVLGPQ
jgi:uncharacterized protein